MHLTKKVKLTSYITQAVGQLYSPFSGAKEQILKSSMLA